jgi:hypothetical protein
MIRPVSVASLLASAALATALAPSAAQAQVPAGNSAPVAQAPFVNTIPDAVDTPYPGTIKLVVDATDTDRGIFRVKETIPVAKAGPMALLFPKWLPGAHTPRGEIEKLAGLVIRANGRVLPWTRDPVDVFAFHIDVPAGATQLDVAFQFLSATKSDQGRIAVTPTMISLQPNSVSLYPAGYYTRQIPIQMTATFPTGWTAAGAVPARASGSTYTYDTTNYEILVDSPGAGRQIWQGLPADARRQAERLCRQSRRTGRQARTDRGAHPPGRTGRKDLRRASFRSL